MSTLLRIAEGDMVAVALAPIAAGERAEFDGGTIVPREDIPMGHKAALRDIAAGERVSRGREGAVTIDDMRAAIEVCVKPRFVDMNLAAIDIAVEALG